MWPRKTQIPRLAARLLLLLGATFIALLGAELFLRLFAPPRFYPASHLIGLHRPRYMMWSSPHFRLDEQGAVRYRPNETIRLVAVCYGRVIYDVRYRTNNLGLIDHRDYKAGPARPVGARRIAIVGDSFVAGMHGGEPWVPALRDRVQESGENIEIYNLGVSGTCFVHAEKLLKSVGAALSFDEIVILGLSDDFGRSFWTPHSQGDKIWFAREGLPIDVVLRRRPAGRIISGDEAQEELVARAERWYEEEKRAAQSTGLVGRSYLVQLGRIAYRRFVGHRKSNKVCAWENVAALSQIRKEFPDVPISFVHVPRRGEIERAAYELDAEPLLRQAGIRYVPALRDADWSTDEFQDFDGHPNALGYRRIADYVTKLLKI